MGGAAAQGQTSLYHISAYEKAACISDATRLCAETYPDEQLLLGCMKANRSVLGATCKVAFESGMKRRHLQ